LAGLFRDFSWNRALLLARERLKCSLETIGGMKNLIGLNLF
jgi:hypothetical protein